MAGIADVLDQPIWEYGPDGVLPPNVPPGTPGATEAPEGGFARQSDFQAALGAAEPVLGAFGERALAAAAAIESFLFAFNEHQLRGPDGKWIKMPTHLRKERRRERDRARREAKRAEAQRRDHGEEPNDNAPRPMGDNASRQYRDARDRFNREIVDHAQFQVNDNEFEGEDDLDLNVDLRELKVALMQDDDAGADEIADRLRAWLVNRYQAEVPVAPELSDFDPEAALQKRLRAALDEYNSEIHALAQSWLDLLNDPDGDHSYLGLSDDDFNAMRSFLGSRTQALSQAIRSGVPAAADRAAATIRGILTGNGLQAEHDLPTLPTEADLRPPAGVSLQALPPIRKENPLLTSGSAYAERLAQLRDAVAQGVWGEEHLGQGAMGETKKLLLNDGTQVVNKRAKGSWSMGGVDWSPRQQTDAEELSALVGGALGLRAPAVQRVDPTTINMEYVPNATAAFNRYYDSDAVDALRVPPEILSSDDGLRMALLDVLIGNPDRHGFNWMLDDEDRIYPIDNGLAFVNIAGTNASDAARSPFVREYFTHPTGGFKDNILTRRDVEWARQQLEGLRPEFERVGQPAWLDQALARLRQVEIRARGGAQHQLPAPERSSDEDA